MKKKNAWTLAELVVALVLIILVAGTFAKVFKPNMQKSKMFVYAMVKNINRGNTSISEKFGDLSTKVMESGSDDWYCRQMADIFTTVGTINCQKNTTNVNMTFSNGVTIQGMADSWKDPSTPGFKYKDIVIDIDGDKGLNKVWIDRFPLRIFDGGNHTNLVEPVNCKTLTSYVEGGSINKSKYCKNGFSSNGTAVSENFTIDKEVLSYDILRTDKADDDAETTTATYITSGISSLEADCAVYGGEASGLYSATECIANGIKLVARCLTDENCEACKKNSALCPSGAGGYDACKTLALKENPDKQPCFTMLHRAGTGGSIIFGSIMGDIDN